jgi:hypothetical protein
MYTVRRLTPGEFVAEALVNLDSNLLLWHIALKLASTTAAINVYASI